MTGNQPQCLWSENSASMFGMKLKAVDATTTFFNRLGFSDGLGFGKRVAQAIDTATAFLDRLGHRLRFWHRVAAAVVTAARLRNGFGFWLWHGVTQAIDTTAGFGVGFCDGLRFRHCVTETVDAASWLWIRLAAEDRLWDADRLSDGGRRSCSGKY